MRTEIARMVANGQSEQQIVDQFVARYGERILSEPRGAKSWWLILVPLITFTVAALGLIILILRHRKKGAVAMATGALPPLDDIDLEWEHCPTPRALETTPRVVG
jgi:cytochrome c-type biogenesis protein CcmH/NrfF